MSGALSPLLTLRETRERSAIAKVSQHRVELDCCLQKQQQQQQQHSEYRRWRVQREAGLFKALQVEPVGPMSLASFRAELTALRQREAVLAAELDEAEQQVRAARTALDDAKRIQLALTKAKEKLIEFLTIEASMADLQREYKEERVLEDFHASAYIRKTSAP